MLSAGVVVFVQSDLLVVSRGAASIGAAESAEAAGCERAALGATSEAATVFDPERLIEIIQELGKQLQLIANDA